MCAGLSSGAAAHVFGFDHVGTDGLNLIQDVGLAGKANGDDQNERGGADHHAECGQREANFIEPKRIECDASDLADHHALLCGLAQGTASVLQDCRRVHAPDEAECYPGDLPGRCRDHSWL